MMRALVAGIVISVLYYFLSYFINSENRLYKLVFIGITMLVTMPVAAQFMGIDVKQKMIKIVHYAKK